MANKKISTKQKRISENTIVKLKKDAHLIPYSPTQELLDENLIGKAVLECLENNDPEGAIEVINIHVRTINRVKKNKKTTSRSMLHSFQKSSTLAKMMAKLIHAGKKKAL